MSWRQDDDLDRMLFVADSVSVGGQVLLSPHRFSTLLQGRKGALTTHMRSAPAPEGAYPGATRPTGRSRPRSSKGSQAKFRLWGGAGSGGLQVCHPRRRTVQPRTGGAPPLCAQGYATRDVTYAVRAKIRPTHRKQKNELFVHFVQSDTLSLFRALTCNNRFCGHELNHASKRHEPAPSAPT